MPHEPASHARAARGNPPRITLLTDFGTADGYAAAMKGVIAAMAPAALIDDASHDIRPGDVRAAAWALGAYRDLYPEGTIHVVVVDPGVGTERRPLALHAQGRYFVGPDNGVFSRVVENGTWEARCIEHPACMRASASATFHGRDIFAPAAAQLARGLPLEELGPPVSDPVRLRTPQPERRRAEVRGAVVHVDHYGNAITNIPAEWVAVGALVRMGGHEARLRRTYGDAADGELLALIGSRGVLELAVRNASAAVLLGPVIAQPVIVSSAG